MSVKLFFNAAFIILFMSQMLQAQDFEPINEFIAKQAKSADGEEYSEARKVIAADLNQDDEMDAVVLYTLEGFGGGNNYLQYLAVFLGSESGKLSYFKHILVGGKNSRSVKMVSADKGKILLETLEYLPTDGSCCPSKKGKSQITLKGNILIETKPEK